METECGFTWEWETPGEPGEGLLPQNPAPSRLLSHLMEWGKRKYLRSHSKNYSLGTQFLYKIGI